MREGRYNESHWQSFVFVAVAGAASAIAAASKPTNVIMILFASIHLAPSCGFVRATGMGLPMATYATLGSSKNTHNSYLQIGAESDVATAGGANVEDATSEFGKQSSGSKRFESFAKFLLETQEQICQQAATTDGKADFCVDKWERGAPSEVCMALIFCFKCSFPKRMKCQFP